MTYKKWDVVLLPFPFSNQSIIKKRPGLILSPNRAINEKFDIVIAFMTSNMASPPRIGDIQLMDWKKENLPKPTMVRMKFATIEYSMILKRLGQLSAKDQNAVQKELKSFFTL
ncbi:MAG: type II toxin-antitoxin system PemK/MazF family toxin [Candidatus Marinimicrobia bacterium]|nr:type II toxin-antitoxin system PemK/MazF family toxin [Candidatus Neomarinimicrobiota bacterium]